jgi:hypothetical protein
MRRLPIFALVLAPFLPALGATAEDAGSAAEVPEASLQIAGAVVPAPETERDAATVLGYGPGGDLVTLRQGDGFLVCLADDPSDGRFHAACYHRDLEPFMARGRELRAEGMERAEVVATREKEIAAGDLPFPEGPAALYTVTGPAGCFDPETGELHGANRVYVLYTPYATAESTGLPTQEMTPGGPWIMATGKPWAHVMIVQSTEEPEASGDLD